MQLLVRLKGGNAVWTDSIEFGSDEEHGACKFEVKSLLLGRQVVGEGVTLGEALAQFRFKAQRVFDAQIVGAYVHEGSDERDHDDSVGDDAGDDERSLGNGLESG